MGSRLAKIPCNTSGWFRSCPKNTTVKILISIASLALLCTSPAFGAEATTKKKRGKRPSFKIPDSVEKREVTIWSDGTRMFGDLYLPKERKEGQKFPAIVFCNGTGGTRKGAVRFCATAAANGFVALGFDYRGWGSSESQLMALDPQPKPDENGEMTVKVRALRWQMNYTDQTEDIRAAISFISGEPSVDYKRIGIIGTSYGGGLVTSVAGMDARVKCLVAQVPGMGGQRSGRALYAAYALATRQARGDAEPVPFNTGKMGGKMSSYSQMRVNRAKTIGFSPHEAARKIKVPTLIIDAENEELMDRMKNGKQVAEIIHESGGTVKYHVIPDIGHYGIYREAFAAATKMEIDWFNRYLKPQQDGKEP